MNDRLKAAFDAVRAEEDLKARTRAAIYQRTRGYRRRPRRGTGWAVALACLLLAVGLGAWGYLTPISTVRIDVNPSIELGINFFDRVVSARGRNEDGEALLTGLRLRFLRYAEALDALLENGEIQGYLRQGRDMSILVACEDENREKEMVDTARACASGHKNVHCHGEGWGRQQAQEPASGQGNHCGQASAVSSEPTSTAKPEQISAPEQTPTPKPESKGHGHRYRHGHGHH